MCLWKNSCSSTFLDVRFIISVVGVANGEMKWANGQLACNHHPKKKKWRLTKCILIFFSMLWLCNGLQLSYLHGAKSEHGACFTFPCLVLRLGSDYKHSLSILPSKSRQDSVCCCTTRHHDLQPLSDNEPGSFFKSAEMALLLLKCDWGWGK